jgi:hypothetical protein
MASSARIRGRHTQQGDRPTHTQFQPGIFFAWAFFRVDYPPKSESRVVVGRFRFAPRLIRTIAALSLLKDAGEKMPQKGFTFGRIGHGA